MSVNKAIIVGFVGKDPETRLFSSGDAVTNFSIATTEKYKDKSGEQKESVTWHKIACFAKLSEVATEYVKKGSHLYVEGKIVNRSWKDAQGIEKWVTEIKADKLELLNRVDSSKSESSIELPSGKKPSDTFTETDEDLPF